MATGCNRTCAAQRQRGEDVGIVPGQHLQLPIGNQRLRLGRVAATVLDGCDVGVLGQRAQRGQRKLNPGACRNVVNHHRLGARVGNRREPLQQPGLRGANVVGCRYQQTGQLLGIQGAHPCQRVAQVVARQAHHQRQTRGGLCHGVQHGQLLVRA